MKKLQGAHQRKVGQEDPGAHGAGAHLREGCRGPPPFRPGEGQREHLDRLSALGEAGLS